MTATIKPPERKTSDRRRPLRFSSLETLGFSDATSTWSETPPVVVPQSPQSTGEVPRRGRHEAGPDPLSSWHPEEIGGRLTGGNVRWSLVSLLVLVLAGAGLFGYWLYQRPSTLEQASLATVTEHARSLSASLDTVETFNSALLEETESPGTADLFAVEAEARALFSSSGSLDGSATTLRSAALRAASSTLDGIRLASDAHSYRAAVLPILAAPRLETDPELIALDEAARQFGAWQLSFDQVRTALPDQVLPDVTQQIDILSGDLTSIMGRYVDALRDDDEAAANGALLELNSRLAQVQGVMNEAILGVQDRVSSRLTEVRQSLDDIFDG
jgi:hypothetical protein